MLNRKRILSLGLGLSLLLAQTAQAEILITPLDPSNVATEETLNQNQAGQAQAGDSQLTGQTETQQPGAVASGQTGTQQPEAVTPGQTGTQQPGTEVSGQTGTQQPGAVAPGQAGTQQPGTVAPGQTGIQQPGSVATGQAGDQDAVSQEGPGFEQNAGTPVGSGQSGMGSGQNGAQNGSPISAASYSTKEPVGTGVTGGTGNSQAPSGSEVETPVVSAQGVILYDATHDRVLFEKNADTKFFPASVTKLMTALVVLENANLNDTVTFSKSAVTNLESGAVTLKVAEGDKISVKDCMYGLLLKSANEVANGLAEHVGGSISGFAGMMNAKAKALGCTNTNFVNPNGLNDPNHYTTPRDMAKIAKAAFENETLCKIDSALSYQFPATKNVNQTRTLTPGHKMLYPSDSRYYEGIVGGKTGYTSLAGNTLVTCVERDGVRLIAVVLKAKSTQYVDTKAILDYGFALNQAGIDRVPSQNSVYHRWIQDGTAWRFELAGGVQIKNQCVTIDGADYVFDGNGRMLTGWQNLGGVWYCFKENGAMVKNGWMQDQDQWFYLGTDGRMVTNSTIDGKYYVGADGIWIPSQQG